MQSIRTLKEANFIAKSLGLKRGKGTYNGAAYWVRPKTGAIVTRADLAGLV